MLYFLFQDICAIAGMEVFSWQGKNTGKQRKTGKQLTDPVSKQLKLPSDTNIQDVKEVIFQLDKQPHSLKLKKNKIKRHKIKYKT